MILKTSKEPQVEHVHVPVGTQEALAAARRLEVFLDLRDGESAHDKDLRIVISALRRSIKEEDDE